jgi:hypothetical protein
MARTSPIELLRPPAHRGPLIAAGVVVLSVGVALEEARLNQRLSALSHVLILGALTALALGVGLQARDEEGEPGSRSVLLVVGLLALVGALVRLADLLGADLASPSASTVTWVALLEALAAGWAALRRGSAACTLLATVAAGACVVAAGDWILGIDTGGGIRVVLLLLAIAAGLASVAVRGDRPEHADQLVNAGGLAIFAIAGSGLATALVGLVSLFGGAPESLLPGFWELVVLAGGCGLVAYGIVDRARGAVLIGMLNLAAFVVLAAFGSHSLLWWPLVLILLGAGVAAAGLRPRDPLPPEPDPYRAGEQPLAARADEEISLRVRDDSPPWA